MPESPSVETSGPMNFTDFYKKVKLFRLFEPSVGILVLTVCVIFGFFLLDYRSVTEGLRFPLQRERLLWLRIDGGESGNSKKIDFLSGINDGCDVFDGDWVWDELYPLYESKDCRFLDEGFRCSENGRPDFFYTKWRWQPKNCNLPSGCYFQEGTNVKMDMKVDSAYRKALETVVSWIRREVNTTKTQVLFRTYAPVHFRGGDWRSGGTCHLETLPELGSTIVPSHTWTKYSIFMQVIASHSNSQPLDVLNITHMTSRRKDGHSSLYYLGPKVGLAPFHRQDCSHWCLPGVPDAWNELLYALVLKRGVVTDPNLSSFHAQV